MRTMYSVGSVYLGSADLQTSVANAEILTLPNNVGLYKFSVMNDADCHIIVNGGTAIFLRASQGFNIEQYDMPVYSFKIVEAGITFNWIGAY